MDTASQQLTDDFFVMDEASQQFADAYAADVARTLRPLARTQGPVHGYLPDIRTQERGDFSRTALACQQLLKGQTIMYIIYVAGRVTNSSLTMAQNWP